MSKPIIGIAGNQLAAGSTEFWGQSVSYTPHGFISAVQQVDGMPLIIPISESADAKKYVSIIDKLLLTGGQDVSPVLYEEEPHRKLLETNLDRDNFEQTLITEALLQNKPIFAVCRGMQILNVTLEGNLYQDLSLYPDWSVKHVQAPTLGTFTTHSITIEKDSILCSLLGESYHVNSYHHQAIKRLSTSLKMVALSSDQLIEAAEWHDDSQRVLAIQWHPELSFTHHPNDLLLFDFFVNHL